MSETSPIDKEVLKVINKLRKYENRQKEEILSTHVQCMTTSRKHRFIEHINQQIQFHKLEKEAFKGAHLDKVILNKTELNWLVKQKNRVADNRAQSHYLKYKEIFGSEKHIYWDTSTYPKDDHLIFITDTPVTFINTPSYTYTTRDKYFVASHNFNRPVLSPRVEKSAPKTPDGKENQQAQFQSPTPLHNLQQHIQELPDISEEEEPPTKPQEEPEQPPEQHTPPSHKRSTLITDPNDSFNNLGLDYNISYTPIYPDLKSVSNPDDTIKTENYTVDFHTTGTTPTYCIQKD